MKRFKNQYGWHNQDVWYWPDHDEKLMQVNDWYKDVDIALDHVRSFDCCAQAGGACGIWPAYLATHFKKVITFEANHSNYTYLCKNTSNYKNINTYLYALSSVSLVRHKIAVDSSEIKNCGAYYVGDESTVGMGIHSIALDSINLDACDLICLDVEGFEFKALLGAVQTINKFNPVIMIEEKKLPHISDEEVKFARRLLEMIGYKEVARVHRDVVFKR